MKGNNAAKLDAKAELGNEFSILGGIIFCFLLLQKHSVISEKK